MLAKARGTERSTRENRWLNGQITKVAQDPLVQNEYSAPSRKTFKSPLHADAPLPICVVVNAAISFNTLKRPRVFSTWDIN